MPYSKLKDRIFKLSTKFSKIEENLNLCLKSLGSMHDDEMRAREQLDEITELLKKCRDKIRHNSLPIISKTQIIYTNCPFQLNYIFIFCYNLIGGYYYEIHFNYHTSYIYP